MADDKRLVRTAGVYGTFVLPGFQDGPDGPEDLALTPDGTEVTFDQWLAIAAAAEQNHVVVRLDEDFPAELYAAAAEKRQAEAPKEPGTGEQTSATGTAVDGTDTSTGGRRRGAQNGG